MALAAAVIVGGIWIGSESGNWHVIREHHESLTVPAAWHKADRGRAFLESESARNGLWFLKDFHVADLPAAAKEMAKVSAHVREWQWVRGKRVTYYGLWMDHGVERAIRIALPKSQETLGQTVLGGWRPD